ncbi:hypothetical protein BCR44DRAFT_1487613 [Catenaria anguillulae PL171]|uniref:Uncharacterized protein n=1 Tax=Catenaria anguillulae PL171 TaxID=765915 RepID=A0A1Y2HF33_9FUNG|nr:hypothetical protein BCR44DRAFT_1487613 [Catenaria anguillulae PL171]
MANSTKVTTIKFAATAHRGQLCRERLLDRFTPTLPTVLETVPIPRPMYWIRRPGPNDLVTTVPAAPRTNTNRPWSLLSGPIRYTHPDMVSMYKMLESAEEAVDEDDARTIVEAWDAVEVALAKEKVRDYMNETFGSVMAPRTDSGHALTEYPSPTNSHDAVGSFAGAELSSPARSHASLGPVTRADTPTSTQSAGTSTLVPASPDSPTTNPAAAIHKKRGLAAKVCGTIKWAVAKVSSPGTRAAASAVHPQSAKDAAVSDIVAETRTFVLKYARARSTGKRHGNEAAIRAGIVGLLLDSPGNFITDKRCVDWADLFAAGSGSRLGAKPIKAYCAKHASAASTPHILVPYVVGGLLRWVAQSHGERADGGMVHAHQGVQELLQVATGTSNGNGTRTADALAVVELLKVSGAALWSVGSLDARPALAAYLVLGLEESAQVMEDATSVLERAFA